MSYKVISDCQTTPNLIVTKTPKLILTSRKNPSGRFKIIANLIPPLFMQAMLQKQFLLSLAQV